MKIGLIDRGLDLPTTVACARLADVLGFSRYWLNEHHGIGDAWGSPEIVISMLSMVTKSIRLGSAGTLINFHNVLRTASDFRLLSSLYPGRIDLGIARGAPTIDGNRELLRDRIFENYDARLDELLRLVRARFDGQVDAATALPVNDGAMPEVFILGSSKRAAARARRSDLAYCHGLFFKGDPPSDISFTKGSCIAIAGLCDHPAASEASRVLQSSAQNYVATVMGSAAECLDVMEELCQENGVDEIIFLDLAANLDHRRSTIIKLAAELEKRR